MCHMVLPRGLKKFLVDKPTGKLSKGKFTAFRQTNSNGDFVGPPLRGITKLLSTQLFSEGVLPEAATSSNEFKGSVWKGQGGGLKRGRAVDSQVSRLAGASVSARNNAFKFKLSRIAFLALEVAGFEPVCGQRVVVDARRRIGTACDIICYQRSENALVVVELKCGFGGVRTLPACVNSKPQKLSPPCAGADDSILNRHLAQLTITKKLLENDRVFLAGLKKKFDIDAIKGCLLYSCDRDSQLHVLPSWWARRANAILDRIASVQ